jgi:energy-coupling factor transport system ATP-binding protein
VTYGYVAGERPALKELSLEVRAGEILAVVGGNGSGKTTLARLTNGLLLPQEGEVRVGGLSTGDPAGIWDVRRRVGLLFQNPDDQIVGASVEDDIAFGMENLGVPRPQMRRVVAEMVALVGLNGEESREPHLLSGGQRQRLALAAVLALRPALLVLDEPTSMLDAAGRSEILAYVTGLAGQGLSVLLITQHMDETLLADRLLYLEEGRAAYLGPPRDFFRSGRHRGTALGVPGALELASQLPAAVAEAAPVDENELAQAVRAWLPKIPGWVPAADSMEVGTAAPSAVSLLKVRLVYDRGLPFAREALREVDVSLPAGNIVAVVGPTAAGKSSLLQVMGCLLEPTEGSVRIGGRPSPLPGEVGMVFQRPEVQLFAATVADDVATAPRQLGLASGLVEQRVRAALELVGLDPDLFGPRSPHRLSLGEQRRVALAGILSLDPVLLILDEPGAGLDPAGRQKLLRDLIGWARAEGAAGQDHRPRTLIFTSHDLDEVAETADLVVLMRDGRVAASGSVHLLAGEALMAESGLVPPLVTRVAARLGLAEGQRPVRAAELAALLGVQGGEAAAREPAP